MDKKAAVIDLGSNSIVIMIMKISENGSYKMIDQAKVMVRLSEGMAKSSQLQEAPMKKAIDTIRLFCKLIESHQVNETIAVATAAVRNATNKSIFLDMIKKETGLLFEVISGEQESFYDYLGVINTIAIEDCIIVDTGGGSTEIILVKKRKVVNMISIPYGAVVLTEKFLKNKVEAKADFKKLEEFVCGKISQIKWLNNLEDLTIVGLGGSIRNLSKVHQNQTGLFLGGIHNYSMNAAEVDATYELITRTDDLERRKLPGLGKERADIILGGLVPMKTIMEHVKASKLVISGHGLRDGVFFHNYFPLYGWREEVADNVLEHSLTNTLKKYEANIAHSNHVSRLATDIFDQLKDLHKLGPEFRKLLAVAARLHDIGLYVDYYNHQNHGFYLVLNSGIDGLTHHELLICAFIVAMHRNEDAKISWKEYDKYLDKADYENIRILGLLCRIAEGLDRNEYGNIQGIKCTVSRQSLKMTLSTIHLAELEIEAARLSEKMFKKVFKKDLLIECTQMTGSEQS